MNKPAEQMSLRQLAVLWLVAIPASVLLLWFFLSVRATARQKNAKAAPVVEQDPVAVAAFQAGYEFAARWKATGLARPTEQELDGHALRILNAVQIPDEKRGVFITKFKRGFAWGPK